MSGSSSGRIVWRLLAVVLTFALVAAACGDDDDDIGTGPRAGTRC